jgi:glycosyltransferase involved in cell wall biosynthesis
MKYPCVIFYRKERYIPEVDSLFFENNHKLNCTIYFISDDSKLNYLFNSNYQILITYGPDESEYSSVNKIIPDRVRGRWIHFKEITDLNQFNNSINYCFVNICSLPRLKTRPVFSIFTTTYNSYDKILRAYGSLKKQTFIDYEWVIIDDSPDESHFVFLKKLFSEDNKIRLYRRSENSGNIGNVKNEAVSLCRGNYVLELDHDDEILPDVLFDSVKYFENNPDVGFIYMDFINICENGKNFHYGDFICKGYGGYYSQKYNDKWVYVYITPNINNITLSHLVCCPNHPRIWTRSALIESGNYSEFLPICDDYEILLRTFVNTKMAKIHKLGYIQYMNESNNNFSLIRNDEINRIGPQFIQPIFYNKFNIHERAKELNCYEDQNYIYDHSEIWKREDYKHVYSNEVFNPDYDKQYCVIGILNLITNLDTIKELYQNLRNDFILLDSCPIEELWECLDSNQLQRFKCYSLADHSNELLEKYFMVMYKSVSEYSIIN